MSECDLLRLEVMFDVFNPTFDVLLHGHVLCDVLLSGKENITVDCVARLLDCPVLR